MEEKPNEQENNNNIYSDYEHEAKSMCNSLKNQDKNISKSKEISREQKIADLKKETEEAVKLTVKNKTNTSFLKSLVSQDKNRFCFDGFDLDLTYITPRIIAMGLPSTSYEAFYRNDMNDVKNFFNERHCEHYKVYNLCEEKKYAPNIFYKQGYFPFQDHEAPPLNLIRPFCEDAKKFLDEDPKNVVAIH